MNEVSMSIGFSYDAATRRATFTFPKGNTLGLKDVSEEQARAFLERNGAEFQRRDCCLTSVDGQFVREDLANGE